MSPADCPDARATASGICGAGGGPKSARMEHSAEIVERARDARAERLMTSKYASAPPSLRPTELAQQAGPRSK